MWQAGFDDIMETGWSADVPKRRVGGIRRAKVLDDIGDDSDEEEEDPVYSAAPFNQPDIEALAEDPSLAHSRMEGESIYPTQVRVAACGCVLVQTGLSSWQQSTLWPHSRPVMP